MRRQRVHSFKTLCFLYTELACISCQPATLASCCCKGSPVAAAAVPSRRAVPVCPPPLAGELPDDSKVVVDAPAGGASGLTFAVQPDEEAAKARAEASEVSLGGGGGVRSAWISLPCFAGCLAAMLPPPLLAAAS